MQATMMMTMKQAISDVLETMFFLPIQFVEGDGISGKWFSDGSELMQAMVRFNGPVSGSFFLLVPANMAREITANFLGLAEEEVEKSQEEDTVKEALNMIGGYLLSHMDEADEFQLDIPEILLKNSFKMESYRNSQENMIFIETEVNRLAAGIRLD